jgi:hypothetical protein
MEYNFATLKSMFSGSSSPGYNEAGQPWFDTNKKILKIRNQANSTWLGVMYGTTASKIWMYSNSATDGWVVYSSVTDKVLALKGGSAAYNRTGGGVGGSWTQPTHRHTISTQANHVHQIRNYRGTNLDDQVYNSSGTAFDMHRANIDTDTNVYYRIELNKSDSDGEGGYNAYTHAADWYTKVGGSHNHTGYTGNSAGANTYRPYAAVGTMQYPNI